MDEQRFHIVGVAGVGMCAVAELLVGQGHRVSGSDRFLDSGDRLPVLDVLERQGVSLRPQDGSGVDRDVQAVVVSTAIEEDNPEIQAARQWGVPVKHRSQMLVEQLRDYRCIAIAGTSGKTTVTGMVGWILEEAGLDPTVVNGGGGLNWRHEAGTGSVRIGRSDLCVVETDESDKSLLRFQPAGAVITNMSRDHFGEAETVALFQDFAEQVDGPLVCGAGVGERLRQRKTLMKRDIVEQPWPDLRIEPGRDPAFDDGRGEVRLRVPGRHNLQNAYLAATLCEQLGVPFETIRDALERFKGIHRRLETVGRVRGIQVLDDYAHNPEKIRAAWEAVSGSATRVLGVWRPHGFKPLRMMMDDLVDVLTDTCRPQDELYLLPVFYAGGTASKDVHSEELAQKAQGNGLNVFSVSGYAELQKRLVDRACSGDSILVMGARDPQLPFFSKGIVEALH